MEVLSLIFFVLVGVLSIIMIFLLSENSSKEHTKYHGEDIYFDTYLEKHRKIIKLQKKMILKKKVNLYLKKKFRKWENVND
ncbi:hypothetical protein EGP99_05135 [bacterium]|jgi:hypothetical protein|nr:hypothetical protein [bacterium]